MPAKKKISAMPSTMPSPFGRPAAPAPAPKAVASPVTEEALEAPAAGKKSNRKLSAPTYPSDRRPTGLTKWVGTSSILFHKDHVDPRYVEALKSLVPGAQVHDKIVQDMITKALLGHNGPVKVTRRCIVPINFSAEVAGKDVRLDLSAAVYHSSTSKHSAIVNAKYGPLPATLWVARHDFGYIFDAPKDEDVTLIAAPFSPDNKLFAALMLLGKDSVVECQVLAHLDSLTFAKTSPLPDVDKALLEGLAALPPSKLEPLRAQVVKGFWAMSDAQMETVLDEAFLMLGLGARE